jgi:hypothetical protein
MRLTKICIVISLLLLPMVVNAAENHGDANKFWKAFRQAVLGSNTAGIVAMTRFPFEVRGVDDHDPVKRYNRQKFPAIFRQVVSQQVVVMTEKDVVEKTMFQVIKERKDLKAADMAAPDFFTVELFSFRLINNRWLFTRAYQEGS